MTNEEKISRTPFPNSKKVYIDGDIHPIKVAMREITLADTKCQTAHREKIRQLLFTILRDRSLIPISKSTFAKDCLIREQWILDRNDVEELSEISSDYGKERLHDEKLTTCALSIYTNRCVLKGANVSIVLR
jgi:phosphomethylpyrimidine synthase